ncbi:hypothetical protein GYMLUDRAFT_34656 [Collybiopsis luxurians FD-317 M1]|nr:hypothetical protein GYMLUDRAFT_34656 [Collybiopsis luxurians FD-317 M1]
MHSDGASRSSSHNEVQSPNSVGEDAVISIRAAVQDIAFGSIAGMVSEVFEYPFDLAKVRLQAQLLSPTSSDGQPRFKGPMDALLQTRRFEGFTGLYRGLPVPLFGSMAETAAIFVAYSALQNVIRRYDSSSDELTIAQLGFAAAGAGASASFIITPIELVKCKLQVQMMNTTTPARVPSIHVPKAPKSPPKDPSSASIYPHPSASRVAVPSAPYKTPSLPGPLSIVRNVIATNGVGGLWLGHTGTVLRETGGTAVWFAVKEWIARVLKERRIKAERGSSQLLSSDRNSTALLPWESAFAGAIAGAVCVAALYPADTVKSAIQTHEELREMRMYQQRALNAAKEWATSSSSAPPLSPPTSASASSSKSLPKPLTSSSISATAKAGSITVQSSKRTVAAATAQMESTSFLKTFLHIYRTHGVKGLYSGCGMSMARAVPSSGIVFVVYDGLTAWFS